MTERPARDLARFAVPAVVAVVLLSLVPVLIRRTACISSEEWPHPPHWCYTQIPHLLFDEQLSDGRIPYLQPCRPQPTPCDEYPVLTMYGMRAAAAVSVDPARYFVASGLILLMAGLASALALARLVGARALFFAAAPTLILYAFMNWDLLAVAGMVLAVAAALRRRPSAAGVATGLGTAAKFFPLLTSVPLALHLQDRRSVGRLAGLAAVSWLAVNLPFAILGWRGWIEFYRLNATRPPDPDSLWSIACVRGLGMTRCGPTSLINLLSLGVFLAGVVVVWRARTGRHPDTPVWTLGFAVLAIFFLANKVYSPQYDLFLLPWFALVLPDIRLFTAFELAGFAVYVTRAPGIGAFPGNSVYVATLLRDLVLVACVVAYVKRPLQFVGSTTLDAAIVGAPGL